MSDDNLSNEILAFIDGNHSANEFSSSPLSDDPTDGAFKSKKSSSKSSLNEFGKHNQKPKSSKNVNSDSDALEEENGWNDLHDEPEAFPPSYSENVTDVSNQAPSIMSKEASFPPPSLQLNPDEDDDEAYEDKWNSDLMGDDSDREYLESLPELEREKILNERAEKRQMILERKALKRKLRESGLAVFEDSTRRANKSKSEKRQKLEALKGQREEKRRKHETAPSRPRSSHHSTSFSNTEAVHDFPDEANEGTSSSPSTQDPHFDFTLEHLRNLQVTRHQIKNWCFASFFEKAVIGAFVRLNVGDRSGEPVYRVAQIKDVSKYKRTYKLDTLVTNKSLLLAHGKAVREFLADIVSNQPFTESEFNRWSSTCSSEGVALPTHHHYEAQLTELQSARTHVFSEHDVDAILQMKQRLQGNVPRHLAAEKAKLVKQRDIYLSEGDIAKAKEVESQLLVLKQSTSEETKLDAKKTQVPKRFTAAMPREVYPFLEEKKGVIPVLPHPKDILQDQDDPDFPENTESFQDLVSSVGWDLDIDL